MKLLPKNWILRELAVLGYFIITGILLVVAGLSLRIYFLPGLVAGVLPAVYMLYIVVRIISSIIQFLLKKQKGSDSCEVKAIDKKPRDYNVFKIIMKGIVCLIWFLLVIVSNENLVYHGFTFDLMPFVLLAVLLYLLFRK